ncbi:ATP-dependent Clp protease ATP-binding subunit [Candidatus Kuenenbacteria bacterium]|nr:ATP-dependent Clp protease ATP-binding subunit [Candidatus Kuenenbacteria bacterium]
MQENILNKFTNHYKKTIVRAYGLSLTNKKKEIGLEEIFWSLIAEKGSLGAETLAKAGVKAQLETDLGDNEQTDAWKKILQAKEEIQLAPVTQKIVVDSAAVAAEYGHNYIGTEHLLYSLLKTKAEEIQAILTKHRVETKALLKNLESALSSTAKFEEMTEAVGALREKIEQERKARNKKQKESLLDFFGTDLTAPNVQKNINPVIGRETEISRVIQILARRNKNNPILLGEPGVGKTAIVEGLAKKIMQGAVPDVLADKKIYALDMPLMVAGTSYRGEFEGRLKQIVEEVKMNPEIILFIDEIHNIVGAGSAAGTMDAANILKPALARGEIRCIGATTFEDYKKHIETDSALTRRLQKVTINEPSVAEAIDIIKGVKAVYEKHHATKISDEAIAEAVHLSARYITEQFLPDKALDLIDEAASKKNVNRPSGDKKSKLSQLKKELEALNQEKINLLKEENYRTALAVKEREIEIMSQIYELESQEIKNHLQTKKEEEIGAEDIRILVAEMTKINLPDRKKMLSGLKELEGFLDKKIIGQAAAVKEIARVLKRSAAGLSGEKRPLGSFIFAGPSGVGKTYAAEVLAEAINPKGNGLIRLDMSEYGEKFNASKLIGAPAGYVGYDEGGILTEKVRRNPYAVILLDELEKAHPDIFNLWLSILDEGQLTDGRGRVINFRNTIIIMTTNLGGQKRGSKKHLGFGTGEKTEEQENYQEALEEYLKPEFLNRVDKLVVFNSLKEKDLAKIIELSLEEINQKIAGQKFRLHWDKAVVNKLARECVRAGEGARQVREIIRQEIEDSLADKIIAGGLDKNSVLKIRVVNNKIKLT